MNRLSVSVMLSGNGELSSLKIPEIGVAAEKKGFAGLWFGETTLRDASVLSTIAACSTRRIQLGTSIVNVSTRSPSQLALMAATINEFSGGRFTLGLGVSTAAIIEGWHGLDFTDAVKRLDETVRILRQYFSGERFTFEGSFSSPTNARLRTKPFPKIALAALNDQMIKKAAVLADRIILNLYPTERIPHALKLITDACNRAGKKERPVLSVMLYSHVLGDGAGAFEVGKDLVSFYASAPAYSALFQNIGFASEAKAMTDAWKAKDRDAVKRSVTHAMIDKLMVLGSIEDLRRRVADYQKSGVNDVFICPSPFSEYEANIQAILNQYSS